MALAKVKKIQLIGITVHKDKILDCLQKAGTLQITEMSPEKGNNEKQGEYVRKLQKVELDYANTDFAIKLLSKYEKKKGFLSEPIILTEDEIKEKAENFDYRKIVEECQSLEEDFVKAENEKTLTDLELVTLDPWEKLHMPLENLSGTGKTAVLLLWIEKKHFSEFLESLNVLQNLFELEIIHENETNTFFSIIFFRHDEKELRNFIAKHKCQIAEMPKEKGRVSEMLKKRAERIDHLDETMFYAEEKLKELTKNIDALKIAHDYLGWQKEKLEKEKKLRRTRYNFILQGWIPSMNLEKLERKLEDKTREFHIREIEPEENESPPVIIRNSNFLSPFESVSKIYGLPLTHELDPTPYLAAFFIVFFGLCLTDAGYGLVMFAVMALALKKLRLPDESKKLVKLLMYAGIVTFFIGTIFGGWFGLTPDQVPAFLTKTEPDGEKLFLFQKVNALTNPLTVLILAMVLGFLQILLGVYMKLVHTYKHIDKKEALLDSGPWAFMLTGIGFFIMIKAGILPSILGGFGKWWIILAAATLILTQGRDKKNIVMKLLSGILSLYGLVGYLSDILSYSRLLALGLATAIIGLAVNIIATLMYDMVPYIGWILMIVVFIGGHIFNLLINALGAFIHSGRLQFVEFFTKFMEGGGNEFQPFSKKSKYIFIKNS